MEKDGKKTIRKTQFLSEDSKKRDSVVYKDWLGVCANIKLSVHIININFRFVKRQVFLLKSNVLPTLY